MDAGVVLAGATGNLGGRIASALLAREPKVRAIVRRGWREICLVEATQDSGTVDLHGQFGQPMRAETAPCADQPRDSSN